MTSTTFASRSAPVMEDSMEMSSPAGRPFDNDNDIDIDFEYYGAAQLTDDERMLEDGEPARPGTATDDVMADDDPAHSHNLAVVEEEMQDSDAADDSTHHDIADEELIDYDDEVFEDQDRVDVPETTADHGEGELAIVEALGAGDGSIQHLEVAAVEGVSAAVHLETSASITEPKEGEEQTDEPNTYQGRDHEPVPPVAENGDEEQHFDEATDTHESGAQTLPPLAESEIVPVPDIEEEVAAIPAEQNLGDDVAEETVPRLPSTLDFSSASVADGPPTPTDTGLHPMIVQFGECELPLFKSRRQSDGLLQDDNLVNVSLADLLHNCRDRLASKFGETLSDDQDFVLGFDGIGLMLAENSTHASATSLNDILEVYLQLHQNDGTTEPPALCLTLTTQLKFTSHLSMLKQAAATGTGMSTYVSIHDIQEANEYDQEQEEEIHEEAGIGDETKPHDIENASANKGVDGGADAEAYAHEDGSHPSAERHEYEYFQQGDVEDENVLEYQNEGNYQDDIGDTDQHEDQGDGHEQESGHPANGSIEPEESPDLEEPAHDDDTAEGTDAQDTVPPNSNASSVTIRDEPANQTNELQTEQGEDEFSAQLNTHEGADADDEGDAKHHDQDPEETADAAFGDNDLHGFGVDSKDFLNDESAEDPLARQDQFNEHSTEAFDDADHYEQYDFDQADQVDHSDANEAQPEEDEDQFHTAFDLLDENESESGEDNLNGETLVEFGNGAQPELDDEDDIGFDDDEEAEPLAAVSNSPLGKRSFEEVADEDELNFDEPDVKKPRAV